MSDEAIKVRPPSELSVIQRLLRALWGLVWLLFFRPTPRPAHGWRCFLLRIFAADIGNGVRIYQSARIWAPWNLVMENGSCLGDDVNCYNVDKVFLREGSTVSQYCYLCTASHDYTRRSLPLLSAPIEVAKDAWVTADVFIGPGVTVGEGSVVGARSTITKDVEPWSVVAGSPPRFIREREFFDK